MSEEEDAARKKKCADKQHLQTDNVNLISASESTESLKASHNGAVPPQPGCSLAMKGDDHLQQKHSVAHSREEKKERAAPCEGSLFPQAHKKAQVMQSARSDVWVQTESSGPQAGKVDAATQCDPMRACSCGRSLPSARSPQGLHPPGTAGGHKTPEHEALPPARGSAGTAALSSEAEYLTLADRTTLDILNYIDTMKGREQQ
ncbi:uncharacterized protein LOC109370223 [Meleagris gallopavo]|uniref:uncharacterized protein LOC109370223 n=1 Tax=Meleagris gallopavo TaxID=9103 RepID=UPI00093F8E70|nr:uncharacterized protein LOC109370223 [Meleagris gallopavo]